MKRLPNDLSGYDLIRIVNQARAILQSRGYDSLLIGAMEWAEDVEYFTSLTDAQAEETEAFYPMLRVTETEIEVLD